MTYKLIKIHYFNCNCQGHYGDYILYLVTKKLFKKTGNKLGVKVTFVDLPEKADLILFGGGSVLGMFYWRKIYSLNKPTAVFGSGSSTTNLPPELQELLKRCFLVGVRGRKTQNLLQSVGVDAQVIGDPAFSINPPNVTIDPHLAVGGVRGDTTGNCLKYFKTVYPFLKGEGWNVELLRMSGDDYSKFNGFPVHRKPLEGTVETISKSSLVVGQRLHMTLIGLVAGRKTLGFDYVWGKLEDSLSILDYPYYIPHEEVTYTDSEEELLKMFKTQYFNLLDDSEIMGKIESKISRFRQIQAEFAKQILESLPARST